MTGDWWLLTVSHRTNGCRQTCILIDFAVINYTLFSYFLRFLVPSSNNVNMTIRSQSRCSWLTLALININYERKEFRKGKSGFPFDPRVFNQSISPSASTTTTISRFPLDCCMKLGSAVCNHSPPACYIKYMELIDVSKFNQTHLIPCIPMYHFETHRNRTHMQKFNIKNLS